MELEVRLSRTGEEPWGFRLTGGADCNMPLTVVKVLPNSPADQAGLRNGDTVSRVNGADMTTATHEEAKAAVASALDFLELGVTRGLYDPVLDDYDPTYEPIDQDDFDQPSQPTEVFQIKQFTETLGDNPDFQLDPNCRSRTTSLGPELRSLSESRGVDRSLTDSPFVVPTKPYRPFSTEPTPVPPLEEPIILNPNYHDDFGKIVDEILNGFGEGVLNGETRFKLPISPQYDPDGTRLKKAKEATTEVITSTETNVSETLVTSVEEKIIKEQKEDVKFMEKMKKEIDLDKIEMTATSIVDESIEKAVTVADQIKKEIDLELSSFTSEIKSTSTDVVDSKSIMKTEKKESVKEVNDLITMIDKTTDAIIKESDVNVAEEVAKFESVDKKDIHLDERKLSTKEELDETIVAGSVKRKSEMYNKESKVADVKVQRKSVDETNLDKKGTKEQIEKKEITDVKTSQEIKESIDTHIDKKETRDLKSTNEIKKSEFKSEHVMTTSETLSDNKKEAKYTTAKLLAEQRAYTIGLQTIPHIKGTVQSSYHYDLLLKTFFIHLTDVMVALSRFILAEPVLTKPLEKKQEVTKIQKEETEVRHDIVKVVTEDKIMSESKLEKVEREAKQAMEQTVEKASEIVKENHRQNVTIDNEIVEKKFKSGAEMAQLCEKRSEELIHKMDGVITEFQTKAGLEEEIIIQRERRSRSRSKIEEEVMKESDPLDWLSKVDKKSQETSEIKTSTSISESTETINKARHESTEMKTKIKQENKEVKTEDNKNTYIAIVESHVYTNKNAILEELAEMSQTTVKQNIEEKNIALVVNEATVTERVAIESQTKRGTVEATESHESSSTKMETIVVNEKNQVVEDLQNCLEAEAAKVNQIEVLETIQPIVELQEDIVENTNICMQVTDKIDIQEIQTSEYVGELNVIKEESVEVVQMQDTAVNELQDIKILKEEVKVKEAASVIEEEVKEAQDVQISEKMISTKDESIKIAEAKETTQDFKVVKESTTFDESSAIISDSKFEMKDEQVQLKVTKEQVTEISENVITETKEATQDFKIVKESTTFNESSAVTSDSKFEMKDEQIQIKVTNEEVTEISENVEINQDIEVTLKKTVRISESENKYQSFVAESSVENREYVQESSFTARSTEDTKKLTLDTSIKKSESETSVKSTIDTPTPSTVPPTPLTDEYVFRLQIPLPKITGPPIPRSPSPEDEDPHIVKKKLVPHIDTAIVEEVVYDPPLPTPPEDKVTAPVFTKPGLRGGDIRFVSRKEEIKEIERKSSLLASAIDQTIKSIEEYKEEVGIEATSKPVVYNGYAKVIETKVFNLDKELEQIKVEQQVIKNTDSINRIVEDRESGQCTEGLVNSVNERVTLRLNNRVDNPVSEAKMGETEELNVEGYRPVAFNPEDAPHLERVQIVIPGPTPTLDPGKAFVAEGGEIIGTHQGIVDGLEESVVDAEVAKELGKPGMTEEKIAELISGESEMLREAHVMGLSRVLKSHMHRNDDDSSVDFKKIKPIVESLKDSEVLKALNEEFIKTQEEKKKEERKWTKFLQKPSRPVPKAKFGYPGYVDEEKDIESPYKVKIVKQPKPKIAPDYKPKDFNTGPLPWEERALKEPPPPPVEAEEPILVPEEQPEFLEAIDNLPESQVPDLEETGIPLPPEEPTEEPKPEIEAEKEGEVEKAEEVQEEPVVEETKVVEEPNSTADMENRVAEQLMKNVESMVDPNAPLEQQLAQMRAQLAALAQLPGVIQQTLELVTRQLCQITQQESQQSRVQSQSLVQSQGMENSETIEEFNENSGTTIEDVTEEREETTQVEEVIQNGVVTNGEEEQEKLEEKVPSVSAEEIAKMKREEEEILGEQRRIEKQKKELMAELQLDQESRQLKQRPTPRVGKPKPVFGPLTPAERPLVLPGGRKWRKPKDAYNEQFIAETLTAQAEIIQGKAMGKTYESVHLPYDERVNFMKYEKPPVSLDHLQNSDVYKMIHNMEQTPVRRVDMLTPIIAEADYREKCRSVTPCAERIG